MKGLTVQEIIDTVEDEVGDVIDSKWILRWIDEALDEISLFHGCSRSCVYLVTEEPTEEFEDVETRPSVPVDGWGGVPLFKTGVRQFHGLPLDFMQENEVMNLVGNTRTTHYVIDSLNNIMFPYAGRYQVNYRGAITDVTWKTHHHEIMVPVAGTLEAGEYPPPEELRDHLITELILPVHQLFHTAVILWCKSKYWEFESDADYYESRHSAKFKEAFFQKVQAISKQLKGRKRYPTMIQLPDWDAGAPTEWPF